MMFRQYRQARGIDLASGMKICKIKRGYYYGELGWWVIQEKPLLSCAAVGFLTTKELIARLKDKQFL